VNKACGVRATSDKLGVRILRVISGNGAGGMEYERIPLPLCPDFS